MRFHHFATECRDSSPLYAHLAHTITNDPAVLALASHARLGQPVPNLLFGAVHALLLAGSTHPLAAFYPSCTPTPRPPTEAAPAFADFCHHQHDAIRDLIATRVVQTNEVRRSACLLPAFAQSAALRPGYPLALIELGPSAGLNLRWDTYHYDYGAGRVLGDPAATVALHCALRGDHAPPISATLPTVVARVGIDLHPIAVTDAAQTAWLRALVWPEQQERAALLTLALAAARADPPPLLAGDALALLPSVAATMPLAATLCVFDTFVQNQLSPAARDALANILDQIAAQRPLTHISIGWHEGNHPTITLTTWEAGQRRVHTLATCDPHGAWLRWHGITSTLPPETGAAPFHSIR
jgi:hypothetical protein